MSTAVLFSVEGGYVLTKKNSADAPLNIASGKGLSGR